MTTPQKATRHVPQQIVVQLLEECRDHCCLCRLPVFPGCDHHNILPEVLEKHHIIYFSLGGDHSSENLIIVCPTCHRLVHQFPDKYPLERLLNAKQKWLDMPVRFPKEQFYIGKVPQLRDNPFLRLLPFPFFLESYGLRFTVVAPDVLTILQFTHFLTDYILKPIGVFDGEDAFSKPKHVQLSSKLNSNYVFPSDRVLSSIMLSDGDAFVLHVHRPVVASPAKEPNKLTLWVSPSNPREGESYRIMFSQSDRQSTIDISIAVAGTDGYHVTLPNIQVKDRHDLSVPGAQGGVKDTIVVRGEFTPMSIEVVFGAGSDANQEVQ